MLRGRNRTIDFEWPQQAADVEAQALLPLKDVARALAEAVQMWDEDIAELNEEIGNLADELKAVRANSDHARRVMGRLDKLLA